MKKIFTILCSSLIGTFAFGQLVPNGDFEAGNASWSGTNTTIADKVTVNLSSGGSENLMPVSGTKLALMQNTTTVAVLTQKFAYTQRPNSFRFQFCYLPAGQGELGGAFVRLTKYNSATQKVDTLIRTTGLVFTAGSYPWKEAILELGDKYIAAGNPDTAYVYFITSISASRFQGTSLVLDNIKFSANSATFAELNNNIVGAPTVSPNPMSDRAVINYQINTTSDVKIELYDMTGKMVKEVLNETQNYGKYTADVDASDLNPGVYFYKISTGAYSTTEKLIIAR